MANAFCLVIMAQNDSKRRVPLDSGNGVQNDGVSQFDRYPELPEERVVRQGESPGDIVFPRRRGRYDAHILVNGALVHVVNLPIHDVLCCTHRYFIALRIGLKPGL